MSRMFLIALALIGLAACGKGTPHQVAKSDSKPRATPTATRTASQHAASKAQASKAKSKSQRKAVARADTARRANPLTGH